MSIATETERYRQRRAAARRALTHPPAPLAKPSLEADLLTKDPLTLADVAHRLSCSLSTVERLVRRVNGRQPALESIRLLPGRKSCVRVTQAQLRSFLERREAESLPHSHSRP